VEQQKQYHNGSQGSNTRVLTKPRNADVSKSIKPVSVIWRGESYDTFSDSSIAHSSNHAQNAHHVWPANGSSMTRKTGTRVVSSRCIDSVEESKVACK
jgi:hypothetical protein